jgi:formylglycine-generating enzyme required for sulfatase activity/predicted esterase
LKSHLNLVTIGEHDIGHTMDLSAGDRLGRYEIIAPLGAGGMGEVYRAKHLKLEREVAIKVLPGDLEADPDRLRRFEREARAASALNHPNIVTIHDIDEHVGRHYIAMELIEGNTLREVLARGELPLPEIMFIARQIAEGLAKAHGAGIVHRDLKPENIMVTDDGLVKIVDFGLAKLAPKDADFGSESPTMSEQTKRGSLLGTIPYLSPEQAAGGTGDQLSDQFSYGVLLYEMICGRRPFLGASPAVVLSSILRDTPPPPRSLRSGTPKDLEAVVNRCLEKDPQQRFALTSELGSALRECDDRLGGTGQRAGVRLGWRTAAAAIAGLGIVAAIVTLVSVRGSRVRWARNQAMPEITRLTDEGEIYQAYRLALEARHYLPDDPELQKLIDRITLPISIVTMPAGADVFVNGYLTPEAPWEHLGTTPLERVRIPYALMRWRISKEGFEDVEGAPFGTGAFAALAAGLPLDPAGSRPPGMVRVPAGTVNQPEIGEVALGPYWIDRFEVTNREFKEFVDAGGYGIPKFWPGPIRDDDGRELSWDEAVALFRDTTGRPGPATWELGSYGEGRDDYPVGGVSWYEAAAYCSWAGKTLPTVFHWFGATHQDQLSDIIDVSNFGADGPAPVGSYPGLGDYGTYDMAGNVKEWCWNESGHGRYLLGGAWGEPTYEFKELDARSPLERLPTHGIRCVRLDAPAPDAALDPVTPTLNVGRGAEVSDDVFEAFRRLYAYDRTPLDAVLESVDDSPPHWRKETVSFEAAYGDERVTALLFLPRDAAPPYQTVVWFPGSDVFTARSADALASSYLFDFIPRSGRALVYPVYQGMYERFEPVKLAPNARRDLTVMWSKDLGRTMDYLATREDIDSSRLAYYGFSLGANFGPVFTAIDPRFQASILIGGGHNLKEFPPEIDIVNFAPRTQVPTLMINGKDDFLCPVETAQQSFFELLGAPSEDKRHALLDGGHLPPDRHAIIREVLDWLDRYLGPVATSSAGGATE